MIRYTKLDADGSVLPDDATGHLAVKVERDILARPLIVTAHRSSKTMTWKEARTWAESLDINGWSWRLPTVEEAFLLVDRARQDAPALPPEYFPDCEGEWIWTATKDALPPSGCAWLVDLSNGYSGRDHQCSHGRVRAVRAGQF